MRVLRVLCVLFGFGLTAGALDREAFTFTKYDLEVRLEPEQQRLGARGIITLRNDSAKAQKNAVLQISSSLNWRSIKVAGKPVQFVTQTYTSDIDHTAALSEAIVSLPSEIKPGDSVEVEIGYEGVIQLDTTRLTQIGVPDNIARHSSWDQIGPSFTAVRGVGHVAWYPIATVAADFGEGNSMFQVRDRWRAREADSSMTFHICQASGLSQRIMLMGDVARGVRGGSMGGTDHPSTSFACVEHQFDPLGSITPTLASANYIAIPGSGPVEIYFLSGHEAGAAAYSKTLESVSGFVTEWFGSPVAPVTIADLADPNAAPFESGTLLLASMATDDRKLAEANLAHLLAHSAFSSPRPWIHEGLAHFAAALYRAEKQDGRQAARDSLAILRSNFLDSKRKVPSDTGPGQPLATTYDESYYRGKAAYVWWMLRDMIGEDAFKVFLRTYRAQNDKDLKYAERLLAAASKRDLSWFFEDWVYHDRGLPDFRVLAAHPWKGSGEKQFLTVSIENAGNAGAEVPFVIRFADGEITRRVEVRAKSTVTTRVEVPAAATEIIVNDGSVPESELTNNVFKISGE